MKFALALLISALMVFGCARTTTLPAPQVAPVLAAVSTKDIPPTDLKAQAQEPATTPEEEPTPKVEMTADGKRVVVKGDVWTIEVPFDAGWEPMDSPRYEFVARNTTSRTLVILNREEWVDTQDNYVKNVVSELTKNKKHKVTSNKKIVAVNGRKGTLLEVDLDGAHVYEWVYTTGAEGFVFACGGPNEVAKENKVVCQDMADHFTIGLK